MRMNTINVIQLIVSKKEGDTDLPYRVLDDRVASENAHVPTVKSSYGCSLPCIEAHETPICQVALETKGTTHGNDYHQLHHLRPAVLLRRRQASSSPLQRGRAYAHRFACCFHHP